MEDLVVRRGLWPARSAFSAAGGTPKRLLVIDRLFSRRRARLGRAVGSDCSVGVRTPLPAHDSIRGVPFDYWSAALRRS